MPRLAVTAVRTASAWAADRLTGAAATGGAGFGSNSAGSTA